MSCRHVTESEVKETQSGRCLNWVSFRGFGVIYTVKLLLKETLNESFNVVYLIYITSNTNTLT